MKNSSWDDAIMLRWDQFWPINTFWGGFRYQRSQGKNSLGLAVRAGWTHLYSVTGGPATGSVDVGLAAGGAVWIGLDKRLPGNGRPDGHLEKLLDNGRRAAELADSASRRFGPGQSPRARRGADRAELRCSAAVAKAEPDWIQLMVDVWGKAKVSVFDVELAGVKVDAHASAYAEGDPLPPIRYLSATASFTYTVEVGCDEESVTSEVDLVFIE